MRNPWRYWRPVCDYLGLLLWVFGLLMVVPLTVWMVLSQTAAGEVPAAAFWVPAVIALALLDIKKAVFEADELKVTFARGE